MTAPKGVFYFLFLPLFAVSCFLSTAHAEDPSIDLSASMDPTYTSWSDISTAAVPATHSYLTQRSTLNLKITEKPWVLNFRLENIAVVGSGALPAQLDGLSSRYPKPGGAFFLSQAYFLYSGFLRARPARFEAGFLPLNIGHGLLFSDNDLGVMGIHGTLERWGPFDLEVGGGNTKTNAAPENDLFGFVLANLSGMGAWQIGFLPEIDRTPRALNSGQTAGKTRRNNILVAYNQNFNHEFFLSLEAIASGGSYFLANTAPLQKIETKGSAFSIEGGWKTVIPKLESVGPVDFQFTYTQGSGDKSNTTKDESFFAANATRFNGLERTGWGQYLGASTFDALGSSTTWNGLPQGLSGVSVYGLALKTKPYRFLSLPTRIGTGFYKFRASESSNGRSKDLGSEWSLGFQTELNQRFNAKLDYFNFGPGAAYEESGQKAKAVGGVKLKLSLSFL